jgi:hypothetical protein
MQQYRALIINDTLDPRLDVKKALRIYKKWHLISSAPQWGRIPLSCNCRVCFPHCVCQCTLLLASLFDPEVRVPPEYIAATVSLRKQCRSIQGTAGRKRMRLLEEAKCNEKTVSSKVIFMSGSKAGSAAPCAAEPVIPPAISPSSSDDEFQVPIFS